MDRRKTLKTIFTGTIGATLLSGTSCDTAETVNPAAIEAEPKGYGLRLPHEIAHDKRIANESFFTEPELATLGILGDIIAPGTDGEVAASDTGLLEFLEFMALDQPEEHQTKLRGGLAWLNSESLQRYGKVFSEIAEPERIAIVDDIAYPEEAKGTPMEYGANFFGHLRFLTVTCYFTSAKGMMKSLGYQGNMANIWDGVPQEILDKHGKSYDSKYIPLYVNQERREETAEWDADKNLINNGPVDS